MNRMSEGSSSEKHFAANEYGPTPEELEERIFSILRRYPVKPDDAREVGGAVEALVEYANRSRDAAYSPRWASHGDLLRSQLQETGRLRLAFITLNDLLAALNDLGIDWSSVEFEGGYAVVKP